MVVRLKESVVDVLRTLPLVVVVKASAELSSSSRERMDFILVKFDDVVCCAEVGCWLMTDRKATVIHPAKFQVEQKVRYLYE